jgi:hypothetical protein
MKCIYCEENETRDVLLCYGCQVDLFPLVAAWAYCGVCGKDLVAPNNACPQCTQTEIVPSSVAPAPAVPALSLSSAMIMPATPPLPSLPKEPPVTREEIKQARRFQWFIRAVFALFWLSILTFLLLWLRAAAAQQPPNEIIP